MARTLNVQIQAAADASMVASQASTKTVTLGSMHMGDITCVIAGSSPNGSVKLQKNNAPEGQTATWVDLVNAEVRSGTNSQSFAAAGTINWSIAHVAARQLRVYITRSSGTITADIWGNFGSGD